MLKRTADDDQKRRLLTLLCNSPQGEEIRDEINEWNSSFDFLAVRDNRSQDDRCEQAEVSAKIFVPPGCKPNKWKVDRVLGTGTASAAWMPRAEPPPDQFGEVVTDPEDLTQRAGDWGRVSGDPNRDPNAPARYRLTTSITLPPTGDVVIDVVGRLREVQVNDKIRPISPKQPDIDKAVVLGPAQMTVSLTCEDEDEEEEDAQPTAEGEEDEDGPETPEMSECTAEPIATAQRAIAYQIVIAQAGVARGRPRAPLAIELTLLAEALENLPQSLETGKDSRDRKIRRTRHLVADCKAGWMRAQRGCDVSWNRIEGSETQQQHANYRIVFGDGKALNDDIVDPKTGFIDQRAFDLGLAPLVGFGPQEWGSVGSTLAARSRAQSVEQLQRRRRTRTQPAAPLVLPLTIDRHVQQTALDVLKEMPRCYNRRSKVRKAPSSCPGRHKKQTLTLVAIDAGERPGDILAVASWPPPQKNLHFWDLAALEQRGGGQAGLGWRRTSGNEVPGSTFKAVTALSAIETVVAPTGVPADASAKIADLLSSKLSVAAQADFLRIRAAQDKKPGVKCVVVPNARPEQGNRIPVPDETRPRWCARNYGGGLYWRPHVASATGCLKGADGPQDAPQFGMCEALMVSSNLFFGGLAERLWRLAGTAGGNDLLLAQIARRVTFGRNIGVNPDDTFDLTRGQAPSAKLGADPVHIDVADPAVARKNQEDVIRSGFGDRVNATPLAIATVYASIGSGRIVRPTIVKIPRTGPCPDAKADADECTPLLPTGRTADDMLARLRAGLHAVASVSASRGGPGGTAAAVFNDATHRDLLKANGVPMLYVKTGTATIIRNKRFSLWTAGWIEGAGSGTRSRMAFACFITYGRNSDTGGGTCAKVVADFLVRLKGSRQMP